MDRVEVSLRSLDVAEPGPLDLDAGIAFACGIHDLLPDVFSFQIAIRPYDQQAGVLGLVCYVPCNVLLVLLTNIPSAAEFMATLECSAQPLTNRGLKGPQEEQR